MKRNQIPKNKEKLRVYNKVHVHVKTPQDQREHGEGSLVCFTEHCCTPSLPLASGLWGDRDINLSSKKICGGITLMMIEKW